MKPSNTNRYWLFGILAVWLVIILVGNYNESHPCDSPITYRIGAIDERFSTDRGFVLSAAAAAARIWNEAAHKQIVAADESGTVPINLIYSEQQETESLRSDAHSSANDLRKQVSQLDQEIEPLEADFQAKKSSLDSDVSDLNSRRSRYNLRVSELNDLGGGSTEEIQLLDSEKAELSNQTSDLENRSSQLEEEENTLNTLISERNSLAQRENIQIGAVNADAGKQFLAGQYVERGDSKTINIYEFSSFNDLVAVLTHEIGHALKIPHNNGTNSIMAATSEDGLNKSETNLPSLSEDDLADLKSVCELQ
jgi:hypothetical protein